MIREMKTLLAVADHGTFAAAGDRLGLTQAAVSGHIRRLEGALGFALFERTGRAATLNAAGMRTLARAQDIVARFDLLGQATPDEEWNGTLTVGSIASVQATALARALVPFRVRFPRGRVHVVPGVSLHLLDRLDAGEIDLAILIRPSLDPPKDIVWHPLITETYALLVPAGTQEQDWRVVLSMQPFIRYERDSLGGRQVDRFLRETAIPVRDWLEIDDIQALVSVVAKGLGVALVPLAEAILPLPDTVHAMPVDTGLLHREIGVLHRRAVTSEAVTSLVQDLRDHRARQY